MATTAANPANSCKLIPIAAVTSLAWQARPQVEAATQRRRRVSREAGRAIEILGHAIEYLADEFALDCMCNKASNGEGMHPQVVAIELLMGCNREVYFSCPEVPKLGERLRSLLNLQNA